MVDVSTTDVEFTGMQLKEESTYGVDPGSWTINVFRIPLLTDAIVSPTEMAPDTEEFGAVGGLESLDKLRRPVTGSITVEPRYGAKWFNVLLAHAMAAENIVIAKYHDETGDGVADVFNTHLYNFGTALPVGLSFQIFKVGPGPLTAGYIETVTGAIITGYGWSQVEGNRPLVTFNFLAQDKTTTIATGETLATLAVDTKIGPLDLSRTNSKIMTGATLSDLSVIGFELSVETGIAYPTAYVTNAVRDKPSRVLTRVVTLALTTRLEQDYFAANKPVKEDEDDTLSMAHILYESSVDISAGKPYCLRIDLPSMKWTDTSHPLDTLGVPEPTYTARALSGLVSGMTSGKNDHPTIPTAKTDLRIMTCVKQTDEPVNDTKFSALPNV